MPTDLLYLNSALGSNLGTRPIADLLAFLNKKSIVVLGDLCINLHNNSITDLQCTDAAAVQVKSMSQFSIHIVVGHSK